MHVSYTPLHTSRLIFRGTLVATLLLCTPLFIFNSVSRATWTGSNTWVTIGLLLYLYIGEHLLRHGRYITTNWMLIIFYESLAFFTLFTWGLNTPLGILTISFAVILPSILIGARSIVPVILVTICSLAFVQFLHQQKITQPNLSVLSQPSTAWDVATYSVILAIFALVSWIASNQREKALDRALRAERELHAQKEALRVELEKESAALRHTQLEQIRELHKFALLGQSAAATLHDLSSHLSVLNLDIDDLQQQHANSKAIGNTKESIRHINNMVRQARRQLNSYDQRETFNIMEIITQCLKDMKEKLGRTRVVTTKAPGTTSFLLTGSPVALMHIITILLNNAADACRATLHPQITIVLKITMSQFTISIIDNGPGVDPALHAHLFKPVTSKKSTGMGVGLYIARHLTKHQFNGDITLQPSKQGASFVISIPKVFSENQTRSSHSRLQSRGLQVIE